MGESQSSSCLSHAHASAVGREWCLLCYAARRGRASYAGHYGHRPRPRARVLPVTQYLQRPAVAPASGAGVSVPASCSLSQSFPALVEFLAASKWADGAPRLPGTVTLFSDDGAWKLCLSDKDSQRIAFVTAPSPTEALERAEAGLRGSALDWRLQRPHSGQRRQNRS
jgi:hypothetical protein